VVGERRSRWLVVRRIVVGSQSPARPRNPMPCICGGPGIPSSILGPSLHQFHHAIDTQSKLLKCRCVSRSHNLMCYNTC